MHLKTREITVYRKQVVLKSGPDSLKVDNLQEFQFRHELRAKALHLRLGTVQSPGIEHENGFEDTSVLDS